MQTPSFGIPTVDGSPPGAGQPLCARLELPLPIGELALEAHRSLAAAEGEWRAFESRAAGHPYQCFDWLAAWHAKVHPRGVEPFVVVLRDAGNVRMLLPLVTEHRLGITGLVPMGAPVCDYHGPLIDPDFAAHLDAQAAHRVLMTAAALAGADYVLLTHVPPMLGAVPNPFSALAPRQFGTSAHSTVLGRDWEAMYALRRSAKTRSRFRTKERSLAKAGAIEFSEVTDPLERAALAREMMALKSEQLTATAGAFNTFARREVQDFFLALARQTDNGVFALRLTVGGTLVAAVLCLVRDGCLYYEVPVYPDHELKRFSPGHLLLTRLMEWAIARGCTRFDFTVGDEAYKAEWCDRTWDLRCGAWPRTLRGRLGAALALAGIAAVGQVKKRAALYVLAVRVRTALGRLRQALGVRHV